MFLRLKKLTEFKTLSALREHKSIEKGNYLSQNLSVIGWVFDDGFYENVTFIRRYLITSKIFAPYGMFDKRVKLILII